MDDLDWTPIVERAYLGMHGGADPQVLARTIITAYVAQQRARGVVEVRSEDLRAVITHTGGDRTFPWESCERLESALDESNDR